MSRDDLPLLFASVEHRAWIVGIENRLSEASDATPQMDHHQCRFGLWLDKKESHARYGMQPAFKLIELLHPQVHTLALFLLELKAQNQTADALSGLRELHRLRDTLILHLKSLLRKSGNGRKN